MVRTTLTPKQAQRIWRWIPPESTEAGEERGPTDEVIEGMLDRLVGRKTVSVDPEEAQAVATYIDLWRETLDATDRRLLARLEQIGGLDT